MTPEELFFAYQLHGRFLLHGERLGDAVTVILPCCGRESIYDIHNIRQEPNRWGNCRCPFDVEMQVKTGRNCMHRVINVDDL